MSILKSQSNLQRLRKKSADALGIFQATVSNLEQTNKLIEEESEKKAEEIRVLRDEHIELKKMSSRNSSIMDKINDFMTSV